MNEENKNIDKVEPEDNVKDIETTDTEGTNAQTEEAPVESDEEVDRENDETETDESTVQPLLHALDFEQSESRTTNIPPRLPLGYSYGTESNTTTTPSKKKKANKKPSTTAHPDLPTNTDALQEANERPERSKRYRQRKPNKTWTAFKTWTKRYGIWLLAAIIVIAIAATYQLWSPIVKGWQHDEEKVPAIAADTLPKAVKPVETDSMITTLSHEDSLRIQDSIRHARWLYWKRRKQAQEQAEQEEQEQNSEVTTTPSTEHTTVHTNDTLRH